MDKVRVYLNSITRVVKRRGSALASIGFGLVIFLAIIFVGASTMSYTAQIRDRDAQIESLNENLNELQEDLDTETAMHQACANAADAYRMAGITFAEATKRFLLDPSKPLDLSKATEWASKGNAQNCRS